MWWCSPHAPQDLKEDQILSVQDWYDNEEDSDQKAEEEHHGLDNHACRRERERDQSFTPSTASNKSTQHARSPLASQEPNLCKYPFMNHMQKPDKSLF